jgi:hypothetical protein
MALKPDRIELLTDVSFFMNAAATRGGIVCAVNSASGVGVSMDDSNAAVEYAATASATTLPVGILLNDVVDIDLTRQHINWHKDEVVKGGKVTLLRQGQITTNNVVSSDTPKAGDPAHLGDAGEFTTDDTYAKVGTFLSSKDSDDYVKVSVNL